MINSIEISMVSPLFVEPFHKFFFLPGKITLLKNQNFNLKLEIRNLFLNHKLIIKLKKLLKVDQFQKFI